VCVLVVGITGAHLSREKINASKNKHY
jgi:hypothetical protein